MNPIPLSQPGAFDYDQCLAAYRDIFNMFQYAQEKGPGRIRLLGWDLDFVDGLSLAGFIDQLLVRRLNDFIPDNSRPVILDCGANIGFSVLNYKRQFPDARITAFEPDPQFAPVLRRNLERNGAEDVRVVQAAAWIESGKASWMCQGIDGSRLSDEAYAGTRITQVETVDLAQYITEEVDLLKMDIEGAEYDVVRHLKDRLPMVKNMSIECHVDQDRVARLGQMLQQLKEAGFNVSLNSIGAFRDLIRQEKVTPPHWEQYYVISAWRRTDQPFDTSTNQILPYAGLQYGDLRPLRTTFFSRGILKLEDALRKRVSNWR